MLVAGKRARPPPMGSRRAHTHGEGRDWRIVRHLGILATTPEGAALCFRIFCQQGAGDLGPHDHPDVTLDCIALARSLPAWETADYRAVRATLSVSVQRLARAGADFSPARTTPRIWPSSSQDPASRSRACTSPRWSPIRPPAAVTRASACSARNTPWTARYTRGPSPPAG